MNFTAYVSGMDFGFPLSSALVIFFLKVKIMKLLLITQFLSNQNFRSIKSLIYVYGFINNIYRGSVS